MMNPLAIDSLTTIHFTHNKLGDILDKNKL
jgi:hypothetical protein